MPAFAESDIRHPSAREVAAMNGRRNKSQSFSPDGADPIYAMHPRGGAFSPPIVSEFIRAFSPENGVVFDPFGGSGITAIEALRLGRRAVISDPDPLASFLTKVLLTPISLPLFEWAFQDVRDHRRSAISELFTTVCPRCGKAGVVDYYHRRNAKLVRVEYSCPCSPRRRSKKPDAADLRGETEEPDADIPFWHPTHISPRAKTPAGTRYPADFLRRRTVAALSILLNSIEAIADPVVRDAMRSAFASVLADAHRTIPPYRQAADSETGPVLWAEPNPWNAFADEFHRILALKKETNSVLRNTTVGRSFADLESGRANAILLDGEAEEASIRELPEQSVDYAFAELPLVPPTGNPIPAIQAAWLKTVIDPDRKAALDPDGDPDLEIVRGRIGDMLRGLRRAVKKGRYAHLVCGERGDDFFRKFLALLKACGAGADRIDFLAEGRAGRYVVRVPMTTRPAASPGAPIERLREEAAAAARDAIGLHGRKSADESVLRSFFQRLNAEDICAMAEVPIRELLLPPRARRSGSGKVPDSWRRFAMDLESARFDSPSRSLLVRRMAVRRLLPAGLTMEDALFLMKSLSATEVLRHQRARYTFFLQDWGKAIGFSTNVSRKEGVKVIWKTPAGRRVTFQLGPGDVRIVHQAEKGPACRWGALPYAALERGLVEWLQVHPTAKENAFRAYAPLDILREPDIAPPASKSSPPQDIRLRVVQNRKVCEDHFRIELDLPSGWKSDFQPGQFFHVLCDPKAGGPLPLTLRRPLSVHRLQYPGFPRSALACAEDLPEEMRSAIARRPRRIEFLYRVIGRGTKILSRTRPGTVLRAIGPCGNGFSIGAARTAVIVGGGIGVAPLAALAERLRARGNEVLVYLGAVRKEMLSLMARAAAAEDPNAQVLEEGALFAAIQAEFDEIGAKVLTICTDDGSLGEKGLVTEMLERGLQGGCLPAESVCLYACGPEGMLRRVAEIAARYHLDCQVSLERRMACGVGACYSCTASIRTPEGTLHRTRVCREGPVFEARNIAWKD
jgi:dihydroorotate dehydrogenase electron transfer subunit